MKSEVPAVGLYGITKRFGEVTAVDDADLEITDGEFFALLGPSGCGKTTTLRLIAGLEFPTQGAATPGRVRPPWRSSPELGFEGRVYRFDDVAERFEEVLTRPGCFVFGGWADEADTPSFELCLEAGAAVTFVRHEGLARTVQTGVVDHAQSGVAFVGFRAGKRERYRKPAGAAIRWRRSPQKYPVVRRAVAVFGPSFQVRTLLGGAAAAAIDRGGVHYPQVGTVSRRYGSRSHRAIAKTVVCV